MPTGIYQRSKSQIEQVKRIGAKFGAINGFKKGHTINKGRIIVPKKERECIICGNKFLEYPKGKRKVCSAECRNKLLGIYRKRRPSDVLGKHWKLSDESIKNRTGKNSCHWKGGITALYNQIYNSFEYRLWRSDVFKRDWYKCQFCGYSKELRPHHKKTTKQIIEEYKIINFEEALNCEELWDINNGVTLCEKCHQKFHKRGRHRIPEHNSLIG